MAEQKRAKPIKRTAVKKEQPAIKPEPKVFRPKKRIEVSADDMRKLQCR